MLFITEGLQMNGTVVTYITLRDLFDIFEKHNRNAHQIIMKDVEMGPGCTLKVLPLHVEQDDLPYLSRLDDLHSVLNPSVVFKFFVECPEDTKTLIKAMGCKIELNSTLKQESHHYEIRNNNRNAWIAVSCVGFVAFVTLSFFMIKRPEQLRKQATSNTL